MTPADRTGPRSVGHPHAPRPTRRLLAAAIALLVVAGGAVAVAATAGPRPDLRLARLDNPPAKVAAGAKLVVRDHVVNSGRARSGRSRTGFYLERPSAHGRVRIQIGNRRVPRLRAGRGTFDRTILRIPGTIAAGHWRLLACADITRTVRESN